MYDGVMVKMRCKKNRKLRIVGTQPNCCFCGKKLYMPHFEIAKIPSRETRIVGRYRGCWVAFCLRCRQVRKNEIYPDGHVGKSARRTLRKNWWSHSSTCHYCHNLISHIEESTLDHKVPTAQGGQSCKSNLVLSCSDCNHEKGDGDYRLFVATKRYEVIHAKYKRNRTQGNWPMNPANSYYLGRNLDRDHYCPQSGSPQAKELDIRIRAHQLWRERDCVNGADLEHWFQAVREFDEMVDGW